MWPEKAIKSPAQYGDVETRAQHNTLEMSAGQQFTVTSSQDEVVISTPKTLTLNGGGSYLKLSENGIEHGTNGDFMWAEITLLTSVTRKVRF